MSRLTSRERSLAMFLATALFLLGNWALIGALARQYTQTQVSLIAIRSEIHSLRSILFDETASASRDAWLTSAQPRLNNPEQAGVQLLDEIKQLARTSQVSLENPELGTVEPQPSARSVSVQLTAKGSWAGLIQFFHSLQKPEKFVVFDSMSVQVDPSNAKGMICQIKIAKWYAP